MAQLEEKQLLAELDKGRLRPIYALSGVDQGKLDFFVDRIQQSLDKNGTGCSVEKFYADETKPAAFLDALQNGSLWSGQRLIILKRLDKWAAKDQEVLLKALGEPDPQTHLILLANKLDGRTKFALELGKSSTVANIVVQALHTEEFLQWLHHLSQRKALKLNQAVKEHLQEAGIESVAELSQVLSKLSLFVPEGQSVELAHLEKVQWAAGPERVFALTDAVLARQAQRAFELLLQLEQQGEEPLQLLALLARQFRLLFQIHSLRQTGKSDQMIAAEMRMYPRQAKTMFQGANQRSAGRVSSCIDQVAKADLSLKSTREPSFQVLQRLVLDLAQ